MIYLKMKFYLQENSEVANALINNALRALREREAERKARDQIREVKVKSTKTEEVKEESKEEEKPAEDIFAFGKPAIS